MKHENNFFLFRIFRRLFCDRNTREYDGLKNDSCLIRPAVPSGSGTLRNIAGQSEINLPGKMISDSFVFHSLPGCASDPDDKLNNETLSSLGQRGGFKIIFFACCHVAVREDETEQENFFRKKIRQKRKLQRIFFYSNRICFEKIYSRKYS